MICRNSTLLKNACKLRPIKSQSNIEPLLTSHQSGTIAPYAAYLPRSHKRYKIMQIIDPLYTAGMTDQQRGWFYAEYERAHKDEVIGFLLALILGDFGAHHFYLRRDTAGVLYLIFFWTGIPAILGFIECFFMPGRVRQYNAAQAAYISHEILAHSIPYTEPAPAVSLCPSCHSSIEPSASFCTHCGAAITHTQLSTQSAI